MEKRGITNKIVTKKDYYYKMFNFQLSNVSLKTLLILKKPKKSCCSSSLFIWKVQKLLSISRIGPSNREIGAWYDVFRIIKINHDFLYTSEQKSIALFCIWKRSSSNCSISYWKRGNIEAKDYEENTPLHIACSRGHLQVVQCLSEARDDIKAKNRKQNTPLY